MENLSLTFASEEVKKQWQTKEQLPAEESGVRSIPSITRGFNQGISHMYANPCELEALEDAELMQADIDTRLAEVRGRLHNIRIKTA